MSPQSRKPPASSPVPDRRFAQDVAKHLDRRRLRRKLAGWVIVLGAIVVAALYLTCGRGWGLGKGAGKGAGSGPGAGSANALLSPYDAGPPRCHIRIAAAGISVEGKPATVDEALTACKGAEAAEIFVTQGAREGSWEDLKAAFDRAEIRILRVEPRGGDSGNSTGSGGSTGDTGTGSASPGGAGSTGTGSAGPGGSTGTGGADTGSGTGS